MLLPCGRFAVVMTKNAAYWQIIWLFVLDLAQIMWYYIIG